MRLAQKLEKRKWVIFLSRMGKYTNRNNFTGRRMNKLTSFRSSGTHIHSSSLTLPLARILILIYHFSLHWVGHVVWVQHSKKLKSLNKHRCALFSIFFHAWRQLLLEFVTLSCYPHRIGLWYISAKFLCFCFLWCWQVWVSFLLSGRLWEPGLGSRVRECTGHSWTWLKQAHCSSLVGFGDKALANSKQLLCLP